MTSAAFDAVLPRPARSVRIQAAISAAAVTIPHALGLGLVAFAPLAGQLQIGPLALWSAAVPGALATVFSFRSGVVYAPSTVVALLYTAIVATVAAAGAELGLSAAQVLAACGLTTALGFAFQWLLGAFRLASLARFLPISVMHGFAAGVGLSMIFGQIRRGFGLGGWHLGSAMAEHFLAAVAVVIIARFSVRLWPRLPGLLPGAAVVTLVLWVVSLAPHMAPAAPLFSFALPPLPDYSVPWARLVELHGTQLISLAVLMAVVNSLDVVVFKQELDLEHGLRTDANASLRRESMVGILCGLLGFIPASTSASRTRIVLSQAGPSALAGAAHAVLMLAVAFTGHLWLHWVPMACLSGALLLAGYTQIPPLMWSRAYATNAPASWSQSWLVALVFSAAGGAGALMAGLVVATFVLLHASANSALRRSHLDGQMRSRRLRRTGTEAWLAPRMSGVAVIELQGVMSFGVAAHMAEQVRALLQPRHTRVILDLHRVAAWDATALVQLKALGRDLANEGRVFSVCSLGERELAQVKLGVPVFADLDRALESAEEALLQERPASAAVVTPDESPLGELGEGLSPPGHEALEAVLQRLRIGAGDPLFAAGDSGREVFIVEKGKVGLATTWPPETGIRLASIGPGMPFGEMAFLNGLARTASAGAEGGEAMVVRLSREAFDQWARTFPADALVFMGNVALIGTTRLAATTRQLRAALG